MLVGELVLTLSVVAPIRRGAKKSWVRAQAEAGQHSHCPYAVHPCELLALVTAARVVVDGDFVNSVAEPQYPGRDVRLDVEARAPQGESPPQIRSKDLVASLHVRDVAVEK